MFLKLFKLEWKSFFRSASLGKGIGVKLLLGFFALYFLISFLALGFGLFFILKKESAIEDPIIWVNNYLLFWFLGKFIMRFLLQNLPVVDIKPLLAQFIPRRRIIHALLTKSFYSFYNFLTIAVALPFMIVNMKESSYGPIQLIGWFIGVLGIVFFLNYLNLWIQKHFVKGIRTILPFIAVVLALTLIEYLGIYSISALFGQFFTLILTYPVFCTLPLLLTVFSYRLVFMDLKDNLYLDAYLDTSTNNVNISALSWLDRFGVLAPFIQLDLKLIMRNKRAKNTVFLSLFFLLYGLLFYSNSDVSSSGYMLPFVGIFMSGIFIINFGQFIPAWDSAYFPLFRTQPIAVKNYIQSKVVLMYCSVFILTILSTFYAYFGWDKVYLNVSCAVYNLGINIPIILFFSAYNRKRIDLANASVFNYQGLGVAQWLVGIPLLVCPLVIWGAFRFMVDQHTANMVLMIIGIIGLLLQKVFLNMVTQLYLENRYKMVEGFKQKD